MNRETAETSYSAYSFHYRIIVVALVNITLMSTWTEDGGSPILGSFPFGSVKKNLREFFYFLNSNFNSSKSLYNWPLDYAL